jgi:hypothetical protein
MSSELITSFEQKCKAFIKYLQSYESLSKQYTGEDEEQDGEKLKDQAVDSAKRKWEEIQNVVSAIFNSYQIKNESLNSPDATIGETKPNPLIDTGTIDDSSASKETPKQTPEDIYKPTPTEKEFVESYNRILKDYESQSEIEDEIAKLNFGNEQKPKRMGMSNIGGVLNVESEPPKLSEDHGGNFYGLREDDYYFVVPISSIDVTQNDAIKQVFEIQGSGKYLKEVIKPARFQVQADQDNIITLCSGEKGKISLKDG